jgi:hypothetical protein
VAAVTTEGDEVVVAFLLASLEPERHGWILLCRRFENRVVVRSDVVTAHSE